MRNIEGYVFIGELNDGRKFLYCKVFTKEDYRKFELNGMRPYKSAKEIWSLSHKLEGQKKEFRKMVPAKLEMKIAEVGSELTILQKESSLIVVNNYSNKEEGAMFFGPRTGEIGFVLHFSLPGIVR